MANNNPLATRLVADLRREAAYLEQSYMAAVTSAQDLLVRANLGDASHHTAHNLATTAQEMAVIQGKRQANAAALLALQNLLAFQQEAV